MSRIEGTSLRAVAPPVDASIDESARIDTLPPPTDPQLDALLAVNDPGAAMAGLLLVAGKQRRESARASRDASYAAQEAAQQEEIDHMRSSASTAFVSGLAQGTMQLASAGASAGNACFSAQAGTFENNASTAQPADKPGLATQANDAKLKAGLFGASGTAAGADATIVGAFGKLASDTEDRQAKQAANAAMAMKRSADGASEDVKDAEASLKKALDLYKEWQATKNACLAAAIHRA